MIACFLGICTCLLLFVGEIEPDKLYGNITIAVLISFAGMFAVLSIFSLNQEFEMLTKKSSFHLNVEAESIDKDIIKLNRIIQYNRRRAEIEQEIRRLTSELEKSGVAQYVDINRLAFSGQNSKLPFDNSGAIHYENFLDQFGIQAGAMKLKENSAVFLTPFNDEGERLYVTCQTILSRMGVFLQKTDNLVEKDDILMNIVSLIVQSEFVLVNIDGRNPNVYYELGIAHTLGKPTILLSNSNYSIEDIGFDIRQKRIVIYENDLELETQLLYQINRLKRKEISD